MEKYRLVQEEKPEEVVVVVDTTTTTGTTTRSTDRSSSCSSSNRCQRPYHATTLDTNTTVASTTSTTSEYPEVRITQQGKPRNYISYAMNLLSDGSSSPTIVLKAMGRAINKAVTIAEILKRKISLHQWNVLSSLEMIDKYEPIEEGLDIVENRRYVSCLTITLSRTLLLPLKQPHPQEGGKSSDDDDDDNLLLQPLDIHHFGYQPPLPITELQQQQQQQQSTMVYGGNYAIFNNQTRQQQ